MRSGTVRIRVLVIMSLITLTSWLGCGGCAFHSGELPTMTVTVTGPKDVDWSFGKPADIFAAGRAKAQYVPREVVDDNQLRDVRP